MSSNRILVSLWLILCSCARVSNEADDPSGAGMVRAFRMSETNAFERIPEELRSTLGSAEVARFRGRSDLVCLIAVFPEWLEDLVFEGHDYGDDGETAFQYVYSFLALRSTAAQELPLFLEHGSYALKTRTLILIGQPDWMERHRATLSSILAPVEGARSLEPDGP